MSAQLSGTASDGKTSMTVENGTQFTLYINSLTLNRVNRRIAIAVLMGYPLQLLA
jgi:hypothetical protein